MISYLLLFIGFFQTCLGIWLLTKYEKGQATFWYGFFSFSVAIYVFSNAFGILGIVSPNLADRLAWFGGMSTAVFFLPFSFMYPVQRKSVSELWILIIWPQILLFAGIFFSDIFIVGSKNLTFQETYGAGRGNFFWFMLLIFGFYWAWSIFNLLKSYLWLSGAQKRNILYVILGTVTSLTFSVLFDIIIPIKHSNVVAYLGSIFTSIWLFVTVYIIIRA